MKKYKNVKAIKARKCVAYSGSTERYRAYCCFGVREPFEEPSCKGYMCKCTEYKYDKKRGKFI